MLPQFTLGYKLTFAWESVLQAISTQGDLLPQKTCFTTDPKDSRGPVFRRSPPPLTMTGVIAFKKGR